MTPVIYFNGNTQTILYPDGSRYTSTAYPEQKWNLEFPMSMDIKITNKCHRGCPWCHEKSTPEGVHAPLENFEFLKTWMPGCEAAFGGGSVLEHPQYMDILKLARDNGIVSSSTFSALDVLLHFKELEYLQDQDLLHGIGISWDPSLSDTDLLYAVSSLKHVVWHAINKLVTEDDLKRISALKSAGKDKPDLLVLGYKNFGRGSSWISKADKTGIEDMLGTDLEKQFHLISFDNLAIEQLQNRLNNPRSSSSYFGREGSMSMYLDAVTMQYGTNSTTPASMRHDAKGLSVREMFSSIRTADPKLSGFKSRPGVYETNSSSTHTLIKLTGTCENDTEQDSDPSGYLDSLKEKAILEERSFSRFFSLLNDPEEKLQYILASLANRYDSLEDLKSAREDLYASIQSVQPEFRGAGMYEFDTSSVSLSELKNRIQTASDISDPKFKKACISLFTEEFLKAENNPLQCSAMIQYTLSVLHQLNEHDMESAACDMETILKAILEKKPDFTLKESMENAIMDAHLQCYGYQEDYSFLDSVLIRLKHEYPGSSTADLLARIVTDPSFWIVTEGDETPAWTKLLTVLPENFLKDYTGAESYLEDEFRYSSKEEQEEMTWTPKIQYADERELDEELNWNSLCVLFHSDLPHAGSKTLSDSHHLRNGIWRIYPFFEAIAPSPHFIRVLQSFDEKLALLTSCIEHDYCRITGLKETLVRAIHQNFPDFKDFQFVRKPSIPEPEVINLCFRTLKRLSPDGNIENGVWEFLTNPNILIFILKETEFGFFHHPLMKFLSRLPEDYIETIV